MILAEHKKHTPEPEARPKAKAKSAGKNGKRPVQSEQPEEQEAVPEPKGARKAKRPRGSKK